MSRNNRDGGNFIRLGIYYSLALNPFTAPLFWANEMRHAQKVLTQPIAHELDHQRAIKEASLDGRPLDALANRINDIGEMGDRQDDEW